MSALRRTLIAAIVVLAVVTFGSVGTRAHEEFRWVGTISKLDAKMTRMTMKWTEDSKPLTQVVAITEATSVTRDGTGVAESELKIGRSVVVLALVDPDRPLDVPEAQNIMLVPALKQ